MVRRKNGYHLRVVSYCGDPESLRFERRVDDFLEDLYNVGVSDRTTVRPPLAFSACTLSEHEGRQVALVKSNIRIASQIVSTLKYHRSDSSCPQVARIASLSTVHLQISAIGFSRPMQLLLHEH
jgi:hypothetical protein